MRVLVLGCGLQGRAAVHDLLASPGVTQVTCADADLEAAQALVEHDPRGEARRVDAADPDDLAEIVGSGFDAAVDLLPRQFIRSVGEAAVAAGVHLVNTYYDHDLRDLHNRALEAGVALLPEMGLDPGIDLVMAAETVRRFARVTDLNSYGGGIPARGADDNPLRYRISWTWEGVLNAYARPARLVHEGEILDVPAPGIFDEDVVQALDIAPFGALEAYPNGDAASYAERLGIADSVREAGRYAVRWPGHAATWRTLVGLGFLEEAPVPGLAVTPRQFMVRHLEPRLQYGPGQHDAVIVMVEAKGEGGETPILRMQMVDFGDDETGLMAMNRTVGFPASIAAQMLASGRIPERGLLSPIHHVPWAPFVEELSRRNITIETRWL